MQRVCVLGVTGSGKTTFARALAERTGLPHVELDAVYWGANWTKANPVDFRTQVGAVVEAERWILDGNYSAARGLLWCRADTFIWLDLPLRVMLIRLLRRTLARLWNREELWNGNRESWREQFLSRESLFLWAVRTFVRYRRTYPHLLQEQRRLRRLVYRLRSQREVDRWLS